jgi:photosystem II stability/assembly factor-like uncharacterized protein
MRRQATFYLKTLNCTSLPRSQAAVAVLFALLVLLSLAPAFAAGQMKLLSPNTGWAVSGNTLHWTRDGGSQWKDVTPVPPDAIRAGVNLLNQFFRDTSEGWTVISYPEKSATPTLEELRNQKTIYSIAHTVDGGDSWSFTPLTYPALPQGLQDTFAGPADIYFLDSLHGWLDMAFAGLMRPGKLLATEDGGRSWQWVNSPPHSGPVVFLSLQDGWLLSNEGADQLYVTHDGCKTWQEVSLSPPPQVGAAIYPTFQAPPVFQDPLRGFLVVHYSGEPETPTKLVVYSTIDGGKNWQPAKVLAEAREHTRAAGFPFAIVDSAIIVSTGLSASNVAVVSVPLLDGRASAARLSDRGVVRLTFADTNNGWVQSADGRLLATDNGGLSWKDVGPRRGLTPRPGTTIKVAPSDSFSSSPQPLAAGSIGGPPI